MVVKYILIFLFVRSVLSLTELENIAQKVYENISNATKYGNSEVLETERNELMTKYRSALKNAASSNVKDPTSESEAKQVVDNILLELIKIKNLNINDLINKKMKPELFPTELIREKYPDLAYFDYKNFKDEKLKRRIQILTESQYILQHFLPIFPKKIYYPNVLSKSEIEPEKLDDSLIESWVNNRRVTSDLIKESYGNNALFYSVMNGYNSYADFRYSKHSSFDFAEKLKSVMFDVLPFYTQLHAYIRHGLKEKYDAEIISDTDLIPEQIFNTVQNHIDYPFPGKSLANLTNTSEMRNPAPIDRIKEYNEFYTSLGFPNLPESFWSERLLAECNYQPFRLDDPSTISLCYYDDFPDYLEIMTKLAKVHSQELTKEFSSTYLEGPYRNFPLSIGNAVKLSVITPEYLEKMQFLTNGNIDEETNLNRLYHVAVTKIFKMFERFTYETFYMNFLDLDKNITNCNFRHLQDVIRGVRPPVRRYDEMFDIPSALFDEPNDILLLNDILGFSIYKNLCKITGKYIPGDETHPLNTCNLYGNKKAGELLISILSADPSRYWNDILNEVFGEDGFNPSGILEYFEPLKVWLENENKKNNVVVGWEDGLYGKSLSCGEIDD